MIEIPGVFLVCMAPFTIIGLMVGLAWGLVLLGRLLYKIEMRVKYRRNDLRCKDWED